MSTTGMVMTVTDELLAELDELAGKASAGPWRVECDEDSCAGAMFIASGADQYSGHEIARLYNDDDGFYIASLDPATITALTYELRRLRAENAELAKDAGRYRWLKDNVKYEFYGDQLVDLFTCSPQKIDKLVDTAMAAK